MNNEQLEEVTKELNLICANAHFCSDSELKMKLEKVFNRVPFNIFMNHEWTNLVLTSRVKEDCKRKGIKIEDYNGPLPYRQFKIKI